MAEFNSFYGGRQGASFVIVKRFDGIDIDENTKYSVTYYALDDNDNFIIVDNDAIGNVKINSSPAKYLIKKTEKTFNLYRFKAHANDGSQINNSNYNFPRAYAEGMKQCFSKGVLSSSEVNYGEYVIIDTISKSDPDNGKVFRRGFDIQEQTYAGGEYIGQIVGPKGESSTLQIADEATVKSHGADAGPSDPRGWYGSGEYTVTAGDLVAGFGLPNGTDFITLDCQLGIDEDPQDAVMRVLNELPSANQVEGVVYEILKPTDPPIKVYYTWSGGRWVSAEEYIDKITYSWATIKDEYGNVENAMIGFTIPYLVQSFSATPVSAYYHRDDDGNILKNATLCERTDDGTHGFYQAWNIKVPEGIKGNSMVELEVIDTQVKRGITYYHDAACNVYAGMTQLYDEDNNPAPLVNLNYDQLSFDQNYIPIRINDREFFIKPIENGEKTTCTAILRYKEYNYSKKAIGDWIYRNLGDYNIINKVWLTPNGDFWIDLTHDNEIKLREHIRWIDHIEILREPDPLPDDPEHEKEIPGHVVVYYNDGTTNQFVIVYIKNIDIEEDGTINYTYSDYIIDPNTNERAPHIEQDNTKLRWIKDVSINDNHGIGNQKVKVTYNTKSDIDHPNNNDYVEIGDPLNYIMESAISYKTGETEPWHLLVLYSDPALRERIVAEGEGCTFISRFPPDSDAIPVERKCIVEPDPETGAEGVYVDYYQRSDWHDLGNVKGEKGGTLIYTILSDESLLKDDSEQHVDIPPEYFDTALATRARHEPYTWVENVGANFQKMGYLMSVQAPGQNMIYIYCYDYVEKEWKNVGSLANNGGNKVAETVRVSSANVEPTSPYLDQGGLWFVIQEVSSVF